jgi:hypothetical protein
MFLPTCFSFAFIHHSLCVREHLNAIHHPTVEFHARDIISVSKKLQDYKDVRFAENELHNNRFWKDCLATKVVELKQDAQVLETNRKETNNEKIKLMRKKVMLLKNLPHINLQNGSRGVIIRFEPRYNVTKQLVEERSRIDPKVDEWYTTFFSSLFLLFPIFLQKNSINDLTLSTVQLFN